MNIFMDAERIQSTWPVYHYGLEQVRQLKPRKHQQLSYDTMVAMADEENIFRWKIVFKEAE